MFFKKYDYEVKAGDDHEDNECPEIVQKYRIVKGYGGFYVECLYRPTTQVWTPGGDGRDVGYKKGELQWQIRIPNSGRRTEDGYPIDDGTNSFGAPNGCGPEERLTFSTIENAEEFIEWHKNKKPYVVKEIDTEENV